MQPEQIQLDPHQWVPNNARFPVLVYRQAFVGPDRVAEIEGKFSANGWTGIWHDGVFDYDHYHSGAHEVLGVATGTGTLVIGGPGGETIDVSSGDCLVLPAGTGHRNIGASEDFRVVGAYPPGQHADILRKRPRRNNRQASTAFRYLRVIQSWVVSSAWSRYGWAASCVAGEFRHVRRRFLDRRPRS